ncbi:histidinol-phosphatase [Roseiconus nitratireducens]|uniref:Histidinol-phosphatase n=1 Tax=Roseiconus nitratireducens TaxID=2605748 RepID=A0A5M6DDI7_9BACT|nr:histidinol-phosphatase [Roseiconus nitratireducens]KAA5544470.1 histidinol-phosphatase [Roseiconus nitratireducens]
MTDHDANARQPKSPDQWGELHAGRLAAMIEVAQAAGRHTLRYFRADDLQIDSKQDESPVTVADREAEQLVREQIRERFPDDTVQGEEFAETSGDSAYRWVVDPIDGTKSFVCGVPLYSTLLALECDGQPIGGVIYIPALAEILVASSGLGCWHRGGPQGASGDGAWSRARVSDRSELDRAVFVTSQVDSFDARGAAEAYKRLERECWITRSWGDGYGYLLVATGRADLMVDPACNAWDVAAILPIVVESGGRFTDWKGNATVRNGDGLGTNGKLHDRVREILTCG